MNLESRIPYLESDRDARRRAIEDTANSFVVEASAGTGKTSILINRILHLVLEKGPAGPPLPLSHICAITFTEKAASEMRVRLRQHFEQILLHERSPKEQSERALEALNDLETAAISTFHSFAVSLLKERPVEAGLDPRFTALDAIQSELFFREIWEPWISRALVDRHPVLEKALRNGFRLDTLEELARTLRHSWIKIRSLDCDPPPAKEEYQEKVHGLLELGKSYLEKLKDPEDKLAAYLLSALHWLENPEDTIAALSRPGKAGAAANWKDGKSTVAAVQEYLREIVEFRAACENLPKQQLLYEVVCWIRTDFIVGEWEKRKQACGRIDFDDQLWLAREMLLKNKTVRREFQLQYRTLLVDEFQDTDPIQWDIVLLLTSADMEGQDLAGLRPEPGRLFIVGDPKQSIYRFRNADIETYLEVVNREHRESLGLGLLELTTNFRSVPSILSFVDNAFAPVMKAGPDERRYQGDYLPFGGQGYRTEELHAPSVHLLGDKADESRAKRNTKEFVKLESKKIAGLICAIHGSDSWKIADSIHKEESGWRVPQYGDIAVLLPVLTRVDVLEDEFREMGIPYVLEGGKFYYARSEVSSAITVLRAVANPNDSVALYGSLRSVFFGLSDEDLLRAHIEGLPLDYREQVPDDSPLHFPFEILRNLHLHRHERRASESFEVLLQKTGAREVLAAGGFQSLANLNKLGRTLRALQGDAAFSQVVDLLGTMDEEGLAESESRLMEDRSDAVRIMSIHKAKGLDFPIVIVAALGLRRQVRGKSILADPRNRRLFALGIGSKDSGLRTPLWQELAEEEKKRESAELVRLLYVGLTRARDHLILSTHTAGMKESGNPGEWVPATDGTRLDPLGSFIADCYLGKDGPARLIDAAELDRSLKVPQSRDIKTGIDWQAVAIRECEELHALIEKTPSSESLKAAGQIPDAPDSEHRPAEDRAPEIAGSRSVRLGVAFHEAMERVDFLKSVGISRLVQNVATKHRLDPAGIGMLESMMRTSLGSDLLNEAREAARSQKRVLRELPFVRPLDDKSVEEGKIDLIFEGDSGWVLVDYKTDRAASIEEDVEKFFRNKYGDQIREYVNALTSLSIQVEAAYLLLARTGKAIRII
ncbi:MAG: UvrD-helicase domain-containing protein [Acidobacteria bacterium]|nr:UvrD-helicase domain-containing protein [Acidobacteriota bacterium]